MPSPKAAWELKKTKPEIVTEIDRLLEDHTEGQIARIFNDRGWYSSGACRFTMRIVQNLRRAYRLKRRFDRLRGRGLLTTSEVAPMIGCVISRVKYWRHAGVLQGVQLSDNNEHLYHPPSAAVVDYIHQRRLKRRSKTLGAPSTLRGAV